MACLYRGDCLKILPTIKGPYAVVTDPPYGTGRAARFDRHVAVHHIHDRWDRFSMAWTSQARGASTWAVFSALSNAWKIAHALHTPSILFYEKNNPRPNTPGYEAIVISPPPATGRAWRLKVSNRHTTPHPCEKPLALMRWLIRLVVPHDAVIVDPFCGSGSTLLAGIELGHRVIGIERDRGFARLAASRLEKLEAALGH